MKSLRVFLNESIISESNRDASVANLKNFGFEPDKRGLTCTKDGKTYDIYINGMPEKGKCVMISFTTISVVHQDWGIVFMDDLPDNQDKVYAITDRKAFKEWVGDNLGNAKFIWNSTVPEVKRYGMGSGFNYVTIEVSELAKQSFCEVITK